jgi:hypothetical protein
VQEWKDSNDRAEGWENNDRQVRVGLDWGEGSVCERPFDARSTGYGHRHPCLMLQNGLEEEQNVCPVERTDARKLQEYIDSVFV